MSADQDYQVVATAIGFLVDHAGQPSLAELADHCQLSQRHCQRLFNRWAGLSPKRFCQLLNVERAKQLLPQLSVLETAEQLGLSSQSRLYDQFIQLDGVSPGEYKAGGAGLQIDYDSAPSPFGEMFVGRTSRGICSLQFFDGDGLAQGRKRLQSDWPAADVQHRPGSAAEVSNALAQPGGSPLSLYVRGTNFQISVWRALLRIPPGRYSSYGQLAQALGRPGGARAVGGAVGANPIALLIPCHRVIQQTGALGGYRWGLERKRAIQVWEQARCSAAVLRAED